MVTTFDPRVVVVSDRVDTADARPGCWNEGGFCVSGFFLTEFFETCVVEIYSQ